MALASFLLRGNGGSLSTHPRKSQVHKTGQGKTAATGSLGSAREQQLRAMPSGAGVALQAPEWNPISWFRDPWVVNMPGFTQQ